LALPAAAAASGWHKSAARFRRISSIPSFARAKELRVLSPRAHEQFLPFQHFLVRGDLVVDERTIEIEPAVETDVQQADPQVGAQFGGRFVSEVAQDGVLCGGCYGAPGVGLRGELVKASKSLDKEVRCTIA
jgi:hypothetical protein